MNNSSLFFMKKINFILFFEKSRLLARNFLEKFIDFSQIQIDGKKEFLVKNDTYFPDFNEDTSQIKYRKYKKYTAVLLEDKDFLIRVIEIPEMSIEDIERMVNLEAKIASPFEDEKNLVTYEIGTGLNNIVIYITSKDIVEKYISAAKKIYKKEHLPEVWLQVNREKLVILPGFGEMRRKNIENKNKIKAIFLMAMAFFLLAVFINMPTLNLRSKVLSANEKTQLLAKKTENAMHVRQLLASELALLEELSQKKNSIHHMSVIAFLTKNVPEDTAIQSVSFNGNDLQIFGLSDNASALIPLLSKNEIFSKVEMMNAITRISNTNKDIFNLKIKINDSFFNKKEDE